MRESGSETCRFLLQEHYWASNICITGSWLEVQNLGLPWWSSGKNSVLPLQWRRLIPGQGTKILHAVCSLPPAPPPKMQSLFISDPLKQNLQTIHMPIKVEEHLCRWLQQWEEAVGLMSFRTAENIKERWTIAWSYWWGTRTRTPIQRQSLEEMLERKNSCYLRGLWEFVSSVGRAGSLSSRCWICRRFCYWRTMSSTCPSGKIWGSRRVGYGGEVWW